MNLSAEEKWIKLRVDGGNELLSTNVRYWGAGSTGRLVGIVQSTRMTQCHSAPNIDPTDAKSINHLVRRSASRPRAG